jgi:putative endonuclease
MAFYVYILSNKRRGVLYTGVTNDLVRRVFEHREHLADGFTSKHGVTRLAYFELHETADEAIAREKAIKRWHRLWKFELIEGMKLPSKGVWLDVARLVIP